MVDAVNQDMSDTSSQSQADNSAQSDPLLKSLENLFSRMEREQMEAIQKMLHERLAAMQGNTVSRQDTAVQDAATPQQNVVIQDNTASRQDTAAQAMQGNTAPSKPQTIGERVGAKVAKGIDGTIAWGKNVYRKVTAPYRAVKNAYRKAVDLKDRIKQSIKDKQEERRRAKEERKRQREEAQRHKQEVRNRAGNINAIRKEREQKAKEEARRHEQEVRARAQNINRIRQENAQHAPAQDRETAERQARNTADMRPQEIVAAWQQIGSKETDGRYKMAQQSEKILEDIKSGKIKLTPANAEMVAAWLNVNQDIQETINHNNVKEKDERNSNLEKTLDRLFEAQGRKNPFKREPKAGQSQQPNTQAQQPNTQAQQPNTQAQQPNTQAQSSANSGQKKENNAWKRLNGFMAKCSKAPKRLTCAVKNRATAQLKNLRNGVNQAMVVASQGLEAAAKGFLNDDKGKEYHGIRSEEMTSEMKDRASNIKVGNHTHNVQTGHTWGGDILKATLTRNGGR